ncbi:Myelin and lymphocyte protein, partial [Acipenser ruthenus]
VFGGLVWILVASTKVLLANPQGWVMFVSVFCFVFTFLWFLLFMIGVNQSSPVWSSLDVAYHGIAALFYLSASVAQSSATIALQDNSSTFKSYQEDIAAVVFGGLVWILVASTNVYMDNPQGWVMFVSVFCFVFTFLWLLLFIIGMNQNSSMWATLDVAYHALAAFFYLSASVALAYVTSVLGQVNLGDETLFKYYQEDIAAVVSIPLN